MMKGYDDIDQIAFQLAPGDPDKQQYYLKHKTHTELLNAHITQLIYGR